MEIAVDLGKCHCQPKWICDRLEVDEINAVSSVDAVVPTQSYYTCNLWSSSNVAQYTEKNLNSGVG